MRTSSSVLPVVCSFYTPDFQPIADITVPRLREYCDRHGLKLDVLCCRPKDPFWFRFDVMRRHQEFGIHPIVWIDVDCYVLDMDYDLVAFTMMGDYVTAADRYGLCDCLSSIRDNIWAWKFVQALELLGNCSPDSKHIQQSVKLLLANYPEIGKHVHSEPGLLSDPDGDADHPFLFHAWSSRSVEAALESIGKRVR